MSLDAGPGTAPGTILAQAAVPRDITVWEWLTDPGSWSGSSGILASLADTVLLCAAVTLTSMLLAVPIAAVLAHKRWAQVSSAWVVNIGRALPTFAVAALLVPISLRNGFGFEPWPIFIALTLLTVPPMFLSTYTAVKEVDQAAVDAARAMGYSERAVLLAVELPLGSAVIFTGLRVAAVQVVATEPIRAFLGGDGLGRYVRDGIGQNNASLVIGGTILIAALAGLTGLVFAAIERLVEPQGVRRLRTHRTSRPGGTDALPVHPEAADPEAAGPAVGAAAGAGRLR
jgi:osmoprotectant transport system permease protein